MSDTLETLTDETFAKTLESSARPMVVEFGAVWCPPCHAMLPALTALAGERGDVLWGYVDVEESPRTAVAYGVRSMPTLVLFREGRPVAQVVGRQSRERLERWLDDGLRG